MRLGVARAGDLPRRRLGGVGGGRAARPKSKPSRFPQRHVRLRSLCASGTRRKHSDPLESLSCSAACWHPQIAQCWGGRKARARKTLARFQVTSSPAVQAVDEA